MITRRGLFGWLAGALGLSASKVLAVPADAMPQLVITMAPDMADPSDQFVADLYAKWQQRFKGPPPIILPYGMKVEVVGYCKVRERVGDFELEVVGRSAEECDRLLKALPTDAAACEPTHFKMLHQDVDIADWNAAAMTPNEIRAVRGLPPHPMGDAPVLDGPVTPWGDQS